MFDGWFSVLTKGKGSVIFVIGDGVTYFAQIGICQVTTSEVLPDAIAADGKVTNTDKFSEAKVSAIMRTTDTDARKQTLFKQNILDKYKNSGGIHNNLFVVAINKNSDVNF